ncbi:MAG: DUF1559 domain-containing protein [Armatimonadota bacterium]
MESNQPNEPKPVQWRTLKLFIIACGFVALVTVLFPIVFFRQRHDPHESCISNLKQITLANIMYSSDYDDCLPQNFSFDGPESASKFVTTIFPYLKNKPTYICPEDKDFSQTSQEGIPGLMSYVHCLTLRGVIPEYSTGKRRLNLSDIENPSQTPLMRDRIVGFGQYKSTKHESQSDGKSHFLSVHGGRFSLSFADGHTKSPEPIDEFKEL